MVFRVNLVNYCFDGVIEDFYNYYQYYGVDKQYVGNCVYIQLVGDDYC